MTTPRTPQHPDRRPDTAPVPPRPQPPATVGPPQLLPVPDRLIQALEQSAILRDDIARATAHYEAWLAGQRADNARCTADTRRNRDESVDRGAPDGRGAER